MIDVDQRSLATTLVGQSATMPLAIAPTGLAGLQRGDGEILGARAAAAQCSALMLTADLTVQGQRHRDLKNGLSVPPRMALRNLLDIACRPRWVWHVAKARSRSFGNLDGRIAGADGLSTLAQWISRQFDPTLTWRDLDWIRRLWPGKLILKGIMGEEDARIAAEEGVDASFGRSSLGSSTPFDPLLGNPSAVSDRGEDVRDDEDADAPGKGDPDIGADRLGIARAPVRLCAGDANSARDARARGESPAIVRDRHRVLCDHRSSARVSHDWQRAVQLRRCILRSLALSKERHRRCRPRRTVIGDRSVRRRNPDLDPGGVASVRQRRAHREDTE